MNAVELHNVYQQYGSMAVLDNISLSLAEGEVLGLFGHNGAGKTTTVRLILGLLQATTGEVRVLGGTPGESDIRRQIGFLPENVTFYPQLTGRETLLHFARLKGAAVQQVDDLLEQVGLTAASSKRVKTYSKGMRQRLGLAQALLGRPRLLLLDEPTVGLDPIATQELYQVIGRLRDEGTSIVICSHVLPGVEPYIDRAAVLALGRLEAVGTLHELRSQAQLPVRIRAAGLTVAQLSAPEVQAIRPLHGVWHELLVAPMDKLATVQRILQLQPQDLEVQPPSLEDLYCYYMEQAGALGVAGVQQ
ncbi:MAG: ABC transporter ATP-binding protein [Pseudomonas sp.]|jgi:Cu-processing system ATP-binding protein|nr:ABC transporter ATP-binding protein [Pseudomonas sp.]MDD2222208.1 ABC transporter ATP-binding protein [Pseudomonas sp.]MDY0413532.1 ABC transporter ATP-binding protein [Pseudomonas sp.]NLO54384.1 ABC transporter ATP-binding protein [Gammaproteobacteria bacterium]